MSVWVRTIIKCFNENVKFPSWVKKNRCILSYVFIFYTCTFNRQITCLGRFLLVWFGKIHCCFRSHDKCFHVARGVFFFFYTLHLEGKKSLCQPWLVKCNMTLTLKSHLTKVIMEVTQIESQQAFVFSWRPFGAQQGGCWCKLSFFANEDAKTKMCWGFNESSHQTKRNAFHEFTFASPGQSNKRGTLNPKW